MKERHLLVTGPGQGIGDIPRGMWGTQGGCWQRAQQDLWHMPSLGSKGCVLWGSQAEARLVSSDQKNQSFGKLLGVEYLTHKGNGLGVREECI